MGNFPFFHTFIFTELSPLLRCWNNIKVPYREITGHKGGMKRMLDGLKLKLEGHHHSGIDDCRNIVKICHELTKKGGDMTKPNNYLNV